MSKYNGIPNLYAIVKTQVNKDKEDIVKVCSEVSLNPFDLIDKFWEKVNNFRRGTGFQPVDLDAIYDKDCFVLQTSFNDEGRTTSFSVKTFQA